MSHKVKIEGIEITNLNILERAASRIGGKLIKNVDTFKWYSQSVSGECDHKLSFTDASYEVGIKQNQHKYDLIWDNWYSGGLTKVVGNNAEKLMQAYSIESVKYAAMLNNYAVSEQNTDNGIRLTLVGN